MDSPTSHFLGAAARTVSPHILEGVDRLVRHTVTTKKCSDTLRTDRSCTKMKRSMWSAEDTKIWRAMSAIPKLAFIEAWRARSSIYQHARRVPILIYHQVCDGGLISQNQMSCISPQRFKQQMHFLHANGYTTISLSELLDWLEGRRRLPVKSVCVTFDDGHRDNYYNAFPILQEYGIKATIFIITDQIGKDLWYSRKLRKWERVFDDNGDLYFEFLTEQQIREMDKHGISFQSHTCRHPYLTELPRKKVVKEIKESKDILEQKLGKSVDFLSYPYGAYNSETKNIAKERGYHGAVTCDLGLISNKADKFALKRQYVFNEGVILFQMNLHNLDPIYDKLSKSFKSILK